MENSKQMTRLLRLHEVIGSKKKGIAGLVPMSRSSWYNGIQAGRYPQGIKLSERSVAWRESDIHELIERLAAGGGNGK